VGAGLAYTAYRLYARSVWGTKALLQLQLRHVALYKCYMPLQPCGEFNGNNSQ